ncbi:hypothetical protein QQS21_006043 [Conoideocrella luteorostrata]|uniref:Uncharacterized protein n=1 Tax=Conoideocrella luteorostrata TaxID=1105319 RepID=A0AAJ0G0G3_9HYPO|nr:hypothetical protein QQS21_006043 [Conoideocrella luteorostrata]
MYMLNNVAQHRFSSLEEIYVLDIHRTDAGIATISSDQQLSLLSPSRLGDGPTACWKTQHSNLTTLRVFDGHNSLVCTAGEDGTVGVWDVRQKGEAARVAHFNAAAQTPILSMSCNAATQTIAVGTELQNHTASIYLWDVRSAPSPKAHYQEVHSDDITELAFHPEQPAILLSGSTDGLVNIYDTRIADEDDLTVQTFNHNASIHHAGFLTATEVLALSHDEQFALYDMAEETENGDALQHFGDLRSALGCQYVANVTVKTDGSGTIIGAGAQDRQAFELVFLTRNPHQEQGPKWVFDRDNSVGLPGGHGEEIVRSFCFFDDAQLVFTAGEDGTVKAWRPGN